MRLPGSPASFFPVLPVLPHAQNCCCWLAGALHLLPATLAHSARKSHGTPTRGPLPPQLRIKVASHYATVLDPVLFLFSANFVCSHAIVCNSAPLHRLRRRAKVPWRAERQVCQTPAPAPLRPAPGTYLFHLKKYCICIASQSSSSSLLAVQQPIHRLTAFPSCPTGRGTRFNGPCGLAFISHLPRCTDQAPKGRTH